MDDSFEWTCLFILWRGALDEVAGGGGEGWGLGGGVVVQVGNAALAFGCYP